MKTKKELSEERMARYRQKLDQKQTRVDNEYLISKIESARMCDLDVTNQLTYSLRKLSIHGIDPKYRLLLFEYWIKNRKVWYNKIR